MHRFFVEPLAIQGAQATVTGRVARQATLVLHLRAGEQVVLLDNTGWEHLVTLESVSRSALVGQVVERRMGQAEPRVQLTLFQGVLKGDGLETVFQKGTELGIASFAPVTCVRSVPRGSASWAEGKLERWTRIVTEAAEQSGRAVVPALKPLISLSKALAGATGVRLMAWEGEAAREGGGNGFRQVLVQSMDRVRAEGLSIFVGPEGGFDAQEVAEAEGLGIVPVSLGLRTLRGETAGLVMAAAAMYQMGELGS